MNRIIKIGIIGSGGIARAHAEAYKQLDYVEVVAVADIIPGKAALFIEQTNLPTAKAFDDHQHLLELDLDGVSICTPNFSHHSITIDALNAGKHVMVEKPMSVTLDQGIEMVETAQRTGKMLSVGFQPRYDPNMQAIRSLIQDGQLGKVYYAEAGGGRRRGMPGGTFIRKDLAGVGAMADIGCYSLDMVLHALGYPKPLTVSAYTSNYFGTNPKYHPESHIFNVEDFGAAMVRLEGDILLSYKISWAMHMDTLGPTMFLGTDAGLKVTPAGSGPWSGGWEGRVGSMTLYHDIAGHHTESPIPIQHHQINLFHAKVFDYAEAIQKRLPAPIPGEQILYNQAIIDGVLRSSAAKKEVEIVIPDF